MQSNYQIIFSENIDSQLEDIFFYIALDSGQRAMTFIDEMMTYFRKRLTAMPLTFRKVKGEIRMLPYKRYGILYIVDESLMLVKVLHIVSGGQDWSEWN